MAKKKSKKNENEGWIFGHLEEKTRDGIWAIISLVVSLLFVLAAFGLAGVVGENIYGFLSNLLGVGYYLIPLTSLLLALALIAPHSEDVGPIRIISAIIFFISSLGLLSFVSHDQAGLVGAFISEPLIWLFDVYASFVILLALMLISLIVIFETRIDWHRPFHAIERWFNNGVFEGEFSSFSPATHTDDENAIQSVPEQAPETTSIKTSPSAEEGSEKESSEKDNDSELSVNRPSDDEMMDIIESSSRGGYTPPPVSLLQRASGKPGVGDIKANANLIKRTLENFNIDVEMDEISIGPTVTRYALKPAAGVKLSKITNLQNNLELALAAHPVRIEAPIPGKSLVGIEVPNNSKTMVGLGDLVGSKEFQESQNPLQISLGQGVSGQAHFANINKMPHLLIAGATGAGKSVTAHVLITSLLYRNAPDNLKLIMVDPKRVELTLYNGIPHLLTPVITSAKKAILALKWATKEMERRYDLLEEYTVRDIGSYHENVVGKKPDAPNMPYIVVVIDEMADLMSAYPRELESVIVRLAQMSRAVGIHLVLSTQRPSVNVITGLIKANVPARIALQVASQVDSRTILDSTGAEQLLGAGDMLYQSGEMGKPVRIQSAFISENEVKQVVDHLKSEYEDELPDQVDIEKSESDAKTIFDIAKEEEEKEERDEHYEEARELVINAGKASTSYLQRKLRVGYSRAARIMDTLEENGIITEKDGTKPRDVLVSKEELEKAKTETDNEPVNNDQLDTETETESGTSPETDQEGMKEPRDSQPQDSTE